MLLKSDEERFEFMNTKLKYMNPAKSFGEALPLGNGSLGAMVYGGVPEERITLNYDTFWSGTGHRSEKEIDKNTLAYARKLLFEDKFWEAQQYIKENMLGFYNESYMPLGELDYQFKGIDKAEKYSRVLDLENAVICSEFSFKNTIYQTEVFISNPAKALLLRIKAAGSEKINLSVGLKSKVKHSVKVEGAKDVYIYGNAPSNVQPNYLVCENPVIYDERNPGMAFGCCLHIENVGGTVSAQDVGLKVTDADEVFFYLTAADGYHGYKESIEKNPEVCIDECRTSISELLKKSYDFLRQEHINDYRLVYKNVRLELEGGENDLPLNQRLAEFRKGKQDLGLLCLFFHYNRYLMVASSRKETQPANLQGIWSESIRPVWSSNWTVNINTEMNYWPNGSCNLLESYLPFVDFVNELSDVGKETARKQYHCSGWTANHNIDIWRQTGPVGGDPKYAYWPMGGVWLCSQSYEYYKYSKDIECLKTKLFPAMRGSIEFCLEWLQLGEDGKYYTAPSTSPENTFADREGRACGVSYMTTADLAIIKEMFSNYLDAVKVLGIEDEFVDKILECQERLPGYQISKTGKIQEWIQDFDETDIGHRHFSPIFGLYPGHSIKKEDTLLVEACKKFIEEKVENYTQQIGWSCAWLINLWARLGDGTKANYYYEELLRQSVYDNLFDLHPPLGETEGEREVFQIDGNFGSASAVAEMLLNSEEGKIEILPALPESWKTGTITGILAVGNIEVNLSWKNGIPEKLSLVTSIPQTIEIWYKGKQIINILELKKGERQIVDLRSVKLK